MSRTFLVSALIVAALAAAARAHVPHDDVSALAISPAFAEDGTLFTVVRGRLFRSTDRGREWRRLSRGVACDDWLGPVALSPAWATDRTVFTTCGGDLLVSRDAGRSFAKLATVGPARLVALEVSPRFARDAAMLAIDEGGGLHRSDSGGRSWSRDPADLRASTLRWSGPVAWLGTQDGVVLRARPGSRSWERVGRHPDRRAITSLAPPPASSPPGTGLLVGAEDGLSILAEPAGETVWRPTGEALRGQRVGSLVRGRDGQLYATTWGRALFRSRDEGASWRLFDAGLATSDQADEFGRPHFGAVAVAPDGSLLLASFCGLYHTRDVERGWTKFETTLDHIVSLDVSPLRDGSYTVAAATYGSGVTISRDRGESWQSASVGLYNPRLGPIRFSPDFARDATLFAGTYGEIVRSRDAGRRWERRSTRVPDLSLRAGAARLSEWARESAPWLHRLLARWMPSYKPDYLMPTPVALAVSPAFGSDRTVFVGMHPNGVLRSRDGGDRFSLVWDGERRRVRSLAISPDFERDGTLFAGTDDAAYRTTDRGATWQQVATEAGQRDVVLVVSPGYARDRTVFLAGAKGVLRSRDGGESWKAFPLRGRTDPVAGLALAPGFEAEGQLLAQLRGGPLLRCRGAASASAAPTCDAVPMEGELSPFVRREGAQLIAYAPDHVSDGTVFAASQHHLMVSRDGGRSWSRRRRPMRYEAEFALEDWFFVPIELEGHWHKLAPWTPGEGRFSAGAIIGDQPGGRVRLRFAGTGVRWIGVRGPDLGRASVYLDGEYRTQVDQYGPEWEFQVPTFSALDLPYGPHTLTIEVDGESDSRSNGVRVDVDAFDVLR